MTGMAGMAEWQKEWQNGRMAEMDTYVLFMAGMAGMAGMADGMVGWRGRNGRLAQMDTYVLFTVHTDDDDDDDNTDTLIFCRIDKPIGSTARKSVQGHLLYHL